MPKITLLYTPVSSKKEAKNMARALLEQKLIACANILGSSLSFYPSKNKIKKEKEVILLCKTLPKNAAKAKKQMEKLHSYDCPCILEIPAMANPKYIEWMKNEVEWS